ncbi:MAG: ATP-binding cassette domain-containing protein [Planctomycetes bacterium]|nr:ATP-binding cassette domain-containing protein [Planctomycetota bacterium]
MGGRDVVDGGVIIEVRDLSHRYHDGTEALRGISFSVSRGECVAVIGPNGAGKSTLLLHLNGSLLGGPRVRVCGLDGTKENLLQIRRRVGLLFQDADDQLFMPTLLEDVAFGPLNMGLSSSEAERAAREALRAVGLEGFEARAPYHLSGGEKRCAAIATLVAMRPEILVVDEPSASLDPRSRRRVIDLLRARPETRIIATHDLDLAAELCARAILLEAGRVVADGEAEGILGDRELLESHGLELPPLIRLRQLERERREGT